MSTHRALPRVSNALPNAKSRSYLGIYTVVRAVLPVGRWLESATGLSLKKLVQTLCGYREVRISVGGHESVAAVPLSPELSELMCNIRVATVGGPLNRTKAVIVSEYDIEYFFCR